MEGKYKNCLACETGITLVGLYCYKCCEKKGNKYKICLYCKKNSSPNGQFCEICSDQKKQNQKISLLRIRSFEDPQYLLEKLSLGLYNSLDFYVFYCDSFNENNFLYEGIPIKPRNILTKFKKRNQKKKYFIAEIFNNYYIIGIIQSYPFSKVHSYGSYLA